MIVSSFDVFLETIKQQLEGLMALIDDAPLFSQKVMEIEAYLISHSDLLEKTMQENLLSSHRDTLHKIIILLSILQNKTKARLAWFNDLAEHLQLKLTKNETIIR